MGRDRYAYKPVSNQAVFQSTRPVWGATSIAYHAQDYNMISIHAPRVGRDCTHIAYYYTRYIISIHAPRVGRDYVFAKFIARERFISIHAPRVGRDPCLRNRANSSRISIHAPRVGRDALLLCRYRQYTSISIHAPRVGRDSKFDDFTPSNLHKRYKRVLARPKNTREKGKIKQKLAYIHAFSAFLGCEGSGTFCALVLRTQYR